MHSTNKLEELQSISQLSQKLKIPKPTIRFWEEKLGEFIVPLRTKGGQRRYTPEHVSIIMNIKELRDVGNSISEIKDILGNGSKNNSIQNETGLEILSNRIAQIVISEVNRYLKSKVI